MLYLTTGDKFDTFTTAHTMQSDTAPNGGLYIPFKMPQIDMQALRDCSFCDGVALVLNQFFGLSLTGKEIEFSIGRSPVRLKNAQPRTVIAELYRNLDGSYAKLEHRLAAKICGFPEDGVKITSWLAIAVRIAVLYGVFAQLENTDLPVDIAVPCGDFRLPMAAWYARQMQLPIGNIICVCDQNSAVWDLLRQGQMRTANREAAFVELERLVCATLGVDAAMNYRATCEFGGVYFLPAEDVAKLNQGIFCAVVSDDRIESAIANVYRTNSCILGKDSAASYSGLMDYRAKTGGRGTALILSDQNPET